MSFWTMSVHISHLLFTRYWKGRLSGSRNQIQKRQKKRKYVRIRGSLCWRSIVRLCLAHVDLTLCKYSFIPIKRHLEHLFIHCRYMLRVIDCPLCEKEKKSVRRSLFTVISFVSVGNLFVWRDGDVKIIIRMEGN